MADIERLQFAFPRFRIVHQIFYRPTALNKVAFTHWLSIVGLPGLQQPNEEIIL